MGSFLHSCYLWFKVYSPLLLSLFLLILAAYIDGIMQVLTEREAESIKNLPPLPDIGRKILPHLHFWLINDIYLGLFALATIIRIIPMKTIRLAIFRRFCFIQAVILILRSISIYLTTLTLPLPDCHSTATGDPYIESIYIFFFISRTCADVLFSGHTATITLLALTWSTYSKGEELEYCCGSERIRCLGWCARPELNAVGDPATCHCTIVIVWLFACLGYFFIISTWFHYSVDVFIGFVIAQLVFNLYHYYIKTALEQINWISKFFIWFEGLYIETTETEGALGYAVAWTEGVRENPLYTKRADSTTVGPSNVIPGTFQTETDLEKQEKILVAGEILGTGSEEPKDEFRTGFY